MAEIAPNTAFLTLRTFVVAWGVAIWSPSLFVFVGAWGLMLVIGGPMIRWLKGLRGMKWSPREDTPDSHLAKAGTPSMGGLGIIGVATLAYTGLISLAYAFNAGSYASSARSAGLTLTWLEGLVFLPIVVLLHAALGFADDWSKATGRGGLRARTKLLVQILLALSFGIALVLLYANQSLLAVRYVYPDVLGRSLLDPLRFGLPLLLAIAFIMVACSNAVNLTDGIDGLAAGLAVQCGFALCVIGANNLLEIKVFSDLLWAALAGACLGFLWFNKYPAKVFMGDTGSLALGAALGAAAVAGHAVLLLPFIGFIFWAEMFSVILQVAYFKWTRRQTGEGKRLLRRAPLHHHFELGGWSEWRVVLTFWLVNAFMTAIGLALWSTDHLPRWP